MLHLLVAIDTTLIRWHRQLQLLNLLRQSIRLIRKKVAKVYTQKQIPLIVVLFQWKAISACF